MERKHFWLSIRTVSAILLTCIGLLGCASAPEGGAAPEGGDSEDAMSFFPEDFGSGFQGNSQPSSPSQSSGDFPVAKWEPNAKLALGKADSLNRPLLILFTAMKWSENSQALSKEVLGSRSFNEFARENLVLTFLDFPQSITDAPVPYRNMKKHYEVGGYPTLLLIDPETKLDVYRKVGYSEGKARDYFTEVRTAVLKERGLPVTDWEAEQARKAAEEVVSEGPPLTTEELTP